MPVPRAVHAQQRAGPEREARAGLDAQVAPVPQEILMSLRRTSAGVLYREISFKVGEVRLPPAKSE